MNLLGIDYGSKRVGLALGSSESKLASPLDTLPNNDTLIARLKDIIAKESIGKVVVGLPRGLEGQDTQQTHMVAEFIRRLHSDLQLPIETIDEALTSEAAIEKLGPNAEKADIDKTAAAIILQDYLDDEDTSTQNH